MKKLLSIMLIIILALTCIYITPVKAGGRSLYKEITEKDIEEYNKKPVRPMTEEEKEIFAKMPDEIEVGLPEIEYQKASKVISNKILECTGLDEVVVNTVDWYGMTHSIYEAEIALTDKYSSEMREPTKKIKIKYTNTNQWNQADKDYVDNIIKNTTFDIQKTIELTKDGLNTKYESTVWSDCIRRSMGITDDTIQCIWNTDYANTHDKTYTGPSLSEGVFIQTGNLLKIFKNGVFYGYAKWRIIETPKVIIPRDIEETEEAYWEYAKPIVEKYRNAKIIKTGKDIVDTAPVYKEIYTYEIESNDNNNKKYGIILEKEKGDIDGDGQINTKDARQALLTYVGKRTLTASQKQIADVNRDGKVDTKDARQLLLKYVGKITTF